MAREEKLPTGVDFFNGRYRGRFTYRGKPYVTYQDIANGESKTKFIKRFEEWRMKVRNGLECAPNDITFGDWFMTFAETYKKPTMKKSSYRTYQNNYRNHIAPRFGKVALQKIRSEDLQKFFNQLAETYSQSILANDYQLINQALKKAQKLDKIAKNPCDNIDLPKSKIPVKTKDALKREQIDLFFKYAGDHSNATVAKFALYTGMRIGEIGALSWDDINFTKNQIHVRHTLSYIESEGYYLDTPKSGDERIVPMNDNVVALLKAQKSFLWSNRLAGKYLNEDNRVFLSPHGKNLSGNGVDLWLNRLVKRIRNDGYENFPRVTSHVFRHTFITRCAEAGMSLKAVMDIVGHSDPETTKIYMHVNDEFNAQEYAKLDIFA